MSVMICECASLDEKPFDLETMKKKNRVDAFSQPEPRQYIADPDSFSLWIRITVTEPAPWCLYAMVTQI